MAKKSNDSSTTQPARRPKPRSESSTVPARSSPAPLHTFAIGEVIAETYELRSVLGQGGMGQVFEAHDRVLDRRVAIKVGWPHREREWLRSEARALAAMRHPSMVTVHHFSEWGGLEFVVMERIYGVSLAAHIHGRKSASRPFRIEEVLDIVIGVGEGLALVHRAGLAHRDVKPSNVMLAPGNRLVLMDFGLARPEADRTSTGAPAGTPDYMAPEAILDESRAGVRYLVDVYALGVLAYELLTLETPFAAGTPAAVWSQHLEAAVPDLGSKRSDVPPQLEALVAAMLEKEPERRPQSMDAIVAELRAIRGVQPAAGAGDRPLSVLVVDDDPDATQLLRLLVRRADPHAAISTAHDGNTAIKLIHEHAPDLMLLDLRMPSMNGIELAMYLRGTHLADRTKIVAVSALAKEDDLALLQQLGITEFVAKGPELQARLIMIVRAAQRRGAVGR